MNHRSRASCLMTALLPLVVLLAGSALQSRAAPMAGELRCQCLQLFSGMIPLTSIARVDFIREGPHCAVSEVIVTRKNGRKICLNPTTEWAKKIVKEILKRNAKQL